MASLRETVYDHVEKKYRSKIEHLWMRYPGYAVFRHEDNKKWYGIVMDVPRCKLGLAGTDSVDVLNVKTDDLLYKELLLTRPGFFKGWHFAGKGWLSVLLDGTVGAEEVLSLLDESYRVTASAQKKQRERGPKEWLIPANPKYFDVVHAFDHTDTIRWKQGAGIKKGDTIFLYVAAPVSAVLFRCLVTETDIPADFPKGTVPIRKLMRVRLEKRYPKDRFTFAVLNESYAIYAVRGPRGVPEDLSRDLCL